MVLAEDSPYEKLYRLYDFPAALARDAVPVCFHHGCDSVAVIRLDDGDWRRIAAHLEPPAMSAADERQQIARAIAEFERIAGRLAGTAGDKAGDLAAFGTTAPQQDCIDESSNTTVYLTLLEQARLLRWHRVRPPAHRGYLFFGGWPHYTALIEETGSGGAWVVDSWFHDNGEPPEIIELDVWKDGWKPEGFTF